jgi:hypothetical protein
MIRTLDALHLALIIHCVYYYLVTNYANVDVLMEIVWSYKVSCYHFGPPCSLYSHIDEIVQLQVVFKVSYIS